jgi:hypothetical protein
MEKAWNVQHHVETALREEIAGQHQVETALREEIALLRSAMRANNGA